MAPAGVIAGTVGTVWAMGKGAQTTVDIGPEIARVINTALNTFAGLALLYLGKQQTDLKNAINSVVIGDGNGGSAVKSMPQAFPPPEKIDELQQRKKGNE